MNEKQFTCPTCKGAGESMAHHNTGADSSGHYWANVKCYLCQGEKVVSGKTMSNVITGQSMRRHMHKHGLSLLDAANINGISPASMSSVLLGRKSLHEAIEEAKK